MQITEHNAAIDIAHVTHRFRAGAPVVRNACLEVRPGEFVSIVGPRACGKSTLLKLIAGRIELQQGRIHLGGQVPDLGRNDVACMFPRERLLPWRTVLEHVMRPARPHPGFMPLRPHRAPAESHARNRATQMLERVGLGKEALHYPHMLSPSKRLRVGLARAFQSEAPILLLDEPFSGHDPATRQQLADELLDLWSEERRTTVLVTNDVAEAVAVSDRVIVMAANPGRFLTEFEIPFARPRWVGALQQDSEFIQTCGQVRAWLQ